MRWFGYLSSRKRKRRTLAIAFACGALLMLPSCGIPDSRNPKSGPGMPEKFGFPRPARSADLPPFLEEPDSTDTSALVNVEEFFNDPLLTNLIHVALAGNQELRILSEDVLIARNEILSRQGAFLPFATIGGGIGINRFSTFTIEGAAIRSDEWSPGRFLPHALPSFVVGPLFFWTPDIWRQLHNARDAAAMRYLATAESRTFFVTRLVAEIAEHYFRLVMLDKRIEILDQTIAIQERSLEVARSIKEGARGTELPVQRFLAEVRRNQSEKLIVKQEIIEVENRINFLLGRFPQPVERMSGEFLDVALHALSVGVPPQLLQNRPDIRQAERELAAAGLEVKVARKRFYPQALITAGVGYSVFDPKYLFLTPEAMIANIAGNLVAPLINKKAIQADYMSANARQLQCLYNYQRVILNAFNEIINRLSRVEYYRTSIELKKQQMAALEESVRVAMRLFQFARADYVDVLFAQRDLRDARTVTVETKQQQLSAIINTYQALGGGSYLAPVIGPTLPKIHSWKLFSRAGVIDPVQEAMEKPLPAPVRAAATPSEPASATAAAPAPPLPPPPPPPPATERGAAPSATPPTATPPPPPADDRVLPPGANRPDVPVDRLPIPLPGPR